MSRALEDEEAAPVAVVVLVGLIETWGFVWGGPILCCRCDGAMVSSLVVFYLGGERMRVEGREVDEKGVGDREWGIAGAKLGQSRGRVRIS